MTNRKNTILIVDDHPTSAGILLLLDHLRNAGFSTSITNDGPSAIKQARHDSPDVILMDVLMPGIDGFETCRRLKADETTRDIPVIFMTALSDTADKVKGFEVGAVDYVTKPIQPAEVLVRVNTHLTIRNLQKSLQEEIVERDKLIAELDAFAHTVAHDLKSPLNTIVSSADVLRHASATLSEKELQECLDIMTQHAYKMSDIIDELLLLARVREMEEVEMNPLDMGAIVAGAVERLVNVIKEYQAEIIVPDDWPVALGYGPWIEEVWVNYLDNAFKYGGRPPRVELGATEQADGVAPLTVLFWVRDNGSGLTTEEQAQLFMPFERLDQMYARGYGLGLSIVQRIVEKLGGQVMVESKMGQGSVFSFTLPSASAKREVY